MGHTHMSIQISLVYQPSSPVPPLSLPLPVQQPQRARAAQHSGQRHPPECPSRSPASAGAGCSPPPGPVSRTTRSRSRLRRRHSPLPSPSPAQFSPPPSCYPQTFLPSTRISIDKQSNDIDRVLEIYIS